jgi:glutamyl-tRNA synthetase
MDQHLAALDAAWAPLDAFDQVTTEATLRAVADVRGIKAASLIHAVRVAVTGKSVSPGLFDVVALLGRERTLARIGAARSLLAAAAS